MATDILDVLVVGGGPVGACAAALLARGSAHSATPLRVAVLEPAWRQSAPSRSAAAEANGSSTGGEGSSPSASAALPGGAPVHGVSAANTVGPPMDPRVVAISRASERIITSAGAWDRVRGPRLSPYERMRIWHESVGPRSDGVLVFDAADVGEPNLGYIVENRLLQSSLLEAFADAGGRIEPSELVALHITADHVNVETRGGSIAARLVIGADGAHSVVRNAVGLTADFSDYRETAIVANVATERPHESTAWQRFMRKGTLAFLPLADGTSSIVWSADNDVAMMLVDSSSTDFEKELERASDFALGTTRLVSQRASFPLRRLAAHRYVAQRIALIGDAAHVVHPLAGQGVNLGLLDAAALAQLVLDARRQREDPGALRVLRAYERWRKSEIAVMSTAIDAFDRFLAHGWGPVSRLAQVGLGLVNRSQEVKRVFIRRALGVAGELPRAAQRSVERTLS